VNSRPHWVQRHKWLVTVASLVVVVGIGEALLRFSLFHTSGELASKDPEYYARTLDELWIYRQLFSAGTPWAVGAAQAGASSDTSIEFYKSWATSLVPDAELGYRRASNVQTPCHETTNLGTRGIGDYSWSGPKIVFLGDSFVESAACSNDTLTTKVEKITGIDTLNFGVGGYGVDQIFIHFIRLLPRCDRKDCLFLIGVIQDDLGRMLLAVRTSPKPYFTIRDNKLVLHTAHIHLDALDDSFRRPSERFYLYYFLRGRLGFPIYGALLSQTREVRQQAVYSLSQLIFREMAERKKQGQFGLAFVIFPTPGNRFDEGALSLLRGAGIPVVDLQGCLRGRPDTELYVELHPTSLGNEMLAACLVRDLAAKGLLPSVPKAG